MKSTLLITSLCLVSTSIYAQPGPGQRSGDVGMSPPTVRAEMPRESTPSMPQPAMQRPALQMNQSGPQSAVGATGGTGGNGGVTISKSGSGMETTTTITGPNGGTVQSCGPDACDTPPPTPTPPHPQPHPQPAPQMNHISPQPANRATGGNGGLIMGNGGNGATPLPPTMPRGVGPSPLKNDDVGGVIHPPPPPSSRPPSTPGMKMDDAQWLKDQAQVLEQKHQNDPYCYYDYYGIKHCL